MVLCAVQHISSVGCHSVKTPAFRYSKQLLVDYRESMAMSGHKNPDSCTGGKPASVHPPVCIDSIRGLQQYTNNKKELKVLTKKRQFIKIYVYVLCVLWAVKLVFSRPYI